jgi:hypothetical protein
LRYIVLDGSFRFHATCAYWDSFYKRLTVSSNGSRLNW